MALSRRAHLVSTAVKLFNRDGFHATGIDRVLAEAGVAKMTLYNHFKSKDELILAALRRQSERWANGLRQTAARADTPRGKLLAFFDGLEEWFASEKFSGCIFINACAEYTRPDDPIHMAAADNKQRTIDFIRELAASAGAEDSEGLARQLAILMEGAIVTAQVSGDAGAAGHARAAAAVLIDKAGI